MTAKRCLAALLLLAAAPPTPAAEVETEHYRLHLEGDLDGAEYGRLLEALHARLTEWFGAAPDGKEKLRVSVYADRARWAAALRADDCPVPEAGGYYSPGTRRAYLFVQPEEYDTRRLVLHEATHQFHYLAATGNTAPDGFWYVEGLAEYFSMHRWDGHTLHAGVVPAVTLADAPAQALANLERLEWDVERIVAGDVPCGRPEAWAIIHFLDHEHPRRFQALRRRLDRGASAATTWRKTFGRSRASLAKAFRAWLERHQQPLECVWVTWDDRGPGRVEGSSASNALAVFKRSPKQLEATIEHDARYAGLAYAYESTASFRLFQLGPGDTVRVMRREGDRWVHELQKELPAADGAPVLAIRHEQKGLGLYANGVRIHAIDVAPPGRLGLNVDAGRASFELKLE